MEKRKLGKTGYEISCLCFGAMEMRYLNEKSAEKILNTAIDLGINYVDTSPEYPMSEYYIGKAISHRRSEFILATKNCDNMTGVGAAFIFDRETMMSNLEESLRLMKTDYIDVWQIHGATPYILSEGEYGEVMETMREAKKSGKVLHTGMTIRQGQPFEFAYPAGNAYNSSVMFSGWKDIEVIQLVYGALTRLAENSIQKAYDTNGTGMIARGILKKYDDRYDARFEASKLYELFEEGETKDQFLMRYALTHPALASIVVGTKNIYHLVENVKTASKGKLSPEIYSEAKKRLNFACCVAGEV